MKKIATLRLLFFLFICYILIPVYGQKPENEKNLKLINLSYFESSARHWYNIYDKGNIIFPRKSQARYKDDEIIKIADNILIYQRNNGGWPKNYDMQAILTPEQTDSLVKTKGQLHTTFDNSTTYTHINYLSQVYSQTKEEKYKNACLKGIDFILSAQYKNGGWPQYYPLEKGYSRRITFNDNAMIGIMELFMDILNSDTIYHYIDNLRLNKIKLAYQKGIECILKCQIQENGVLTAWCQQHDEKTFQPAWARKFEPPSICNYESASILEFLMKIEKPDKKIIKSIESAVAWFNSSKILNTRVEVILTPNNKISDRYIVTDSTAAPIWTRYYELGSHRPLFCDRNSKYLYSLAEVSKERRAGYGWYTYEPQTVLNKYPKWKSRWNP